MTSYIAVYPTSPSNPSDKFRVAKQEDFQKYIDGEAKTYPFTTYDSYDEAVAARDKLNAEDE